MAMMTDMYAIIFRTDKRFIIDLTWSMEWVTPDVLSTPHVAVYYVPRAVSVHGDRDFVKGQRDFPVGGQLISLWVDRLCPCGRSADLLAGQVSGVDQPGEGFGGCFPRGEHPDVIDRDEGATGGLCDGLGGGAAAGGRGGGGGEGVRGVALE